MKNKFKKIYEIIKPYIPFILLFAFFMIIHFGLGYISDDRINSQKNFEKGQIDYLIESYKTSSSRLIIYFINNIFYMLPMVVWKIVDSALIVVGALCVSKIFNDKKIVLYDYVICFLVALFPFIQMSSAGFIATTLTYYWPIVFLLISLVPIKKILKKEKVNKYLYPVYFVLLMYATDCEQLSIFLLFISIGLLVYQKFIKKEKIDGYFIFLLFLSLAKLVFIKTCPGNNVRTIASSSARFPLYNTLSLFDKIYMGLLYITNIFSSSGILLFILTSFLCILTNKNNKNSFTIVFSNILLIFVASFTIFNNFVQIHFPNIASYYNAFGVHIKSSEYQINIICIFIALFLYGGLLYLFIVNLKKELLPILLFLGGLATQMVMIFSPTIYASSQRTGSIMFYCFIIIDFILYKKIYSKTEIKANNYIITVLLLLIIVYYIDFFKMF